MRFSNYFLTDSRFWIYRPLHSNFEFIKLSDISMEENKGIMLKLITTILFVGFSVLFIGGIVIDPVNLVGEAITALVLFFTVFYAYSFFARFNRDSYIVRSLSTNKSFKVRTFQSSDGLVFVDELVKSVSITKTAEN